MSPHGEDFLNQVMEAQRRLYAYILSLVPNVSDADDVLQETNAVLLKKRDEFTPGTEFGAWACRVAYYEVLSYRKRQARTGRCAAIEERILEAVATAAESRYSEQDDRLAALGECLRKLGASDRALVRDRYRHDRSADDIAARRGRTSQAIRQVLYRIRTKLLQCIELRLAREEQA